MTREQMAHFLFLLNLYANGTYKESGGLLKQVLEEACTGDDALYSYSNALYNASIDIKLNIGDILDKIQERSEKEECLDDYYYNLRMQAYNAWTEKAYI